MFKLLANNNILDIFNTKEQCKEEIKEYKKIEKAMFGKNTLKFKIVEVI